MLTSYDTDDRIMMYRGARVIKQLLLGILALKFEIGLKALLITYRRLTIGGTGVR